jgi:transposase
LTTKEDQIEWRRVKVMELSSQGYSEREIVAKLQGPSKSTIHNDLVYLRKEAQDSLQHHISEVIPEEYQRCMAGIKQNLRHTLEIAETVADPRVKVQARSIPLWIYVLTLV